MQGKQRRESTNSTKRADATALLKKRMAALGRGERVDPHAERQPVERLAEGLFRHYAVEKHRSFKSAMSAWRNLRETFGELRGCDVESTHGYRYIEQQQAAGAAAASIVYALRILHRMFTLAVEEKRLPGSFAVPHIPAPPVNNTRRGFFERDDFERVAALLPSDVADAARFAYLTGWRRGEVTGLEWRDINWNDRTMHLPSEREKTKHDRIVGLSDGLLALLDRRRGLRRLDCPLVFHRDGCPLGDFRRAWQTACRRAGVAGRHFHDLRRTAVRNLTRAGVQERVAMSVTGHKTRAVFDRYNIVDARDTAAALARVEAHLGTQASETATVAVLKTGTEGPSA